MTVAGESVRFSTVALDLLWERLELGPYPLVLPLLSHGETLDERHHLLDGARRELLAAGLLDGPDVTPRLESWLRVLAEPEHEVHLRRASTEDVLRATVVRRDDECVRVVLRGTELELTPVTPSSQAAAAVALLPDAAPGPGGQLAAPTTALAAALAAGQAGPEPFAGAARRLGASQDDAAALAGALATTWATAQLGVASTRDGQREAHPSVVVVHDTARGRYVVTERPAPDLVAWSTLRPATAAQVVRAVEELLAESARG